MSQIKILHDDREILSQMWTTAPASIDSEHTTSTDGDSLALTPSFSSATRSSRATRNPPFSASNKSKLPAAAIAGAVFGSLVLSLGIMWAWLLYRARMRAQPSLIPTSYTRRNNLREPPLLTPFDLTTPTTRRVRIQVPLASTPPRDHHPAGLSVPRPNRNRGTT
ncbi:hypothetical protein B0H16DRAFT_378962 [Mycena metata]|uniref:Transmembrane protein n=1 Tax=Mycena metata TaxID=1033252 RepID=A0AAD7HHZ9_9AGAR|nr:hypothetical protein B0H16DRAFT_378962 [Mycena metata]